MQKGMNAEQESARGKKKRPYNTTLNIHNSPPELLMAELRLCTELCVQKSILAS